MGDFQRCPTAHFTTSPYSLSVINRWRKRYCWGWGLWTVLVQLVRLMWALIVQRSKRNQPEPAWIAEFLSFLFFFFFKPRQFSCIFLVFFLYFNHFRSSSHNAGASMCFPSFGSWDLLNHKAFIFSIADKGLWPKRNLLIFGPEGLPF